MAGAHHPADPLAAIEVIDVVCEGVLALVGNHDRLDPRTVVPDHGAFIRVIIAGSESGIGGFPARKGTPDRGTRSLGEPGLRAGLRFRLDGRRIRGGIQACAKKEQAEQTPTPHFSARTPWAAPLPVD